MIIKKIYSIPYLARSNKLNGSSIKFFVHKEEKLI